jgi:alanine dehydrogenase
VVNKAGSDLGYSNYSYDVKGATVNNTVYPSIDPMIFEVKYPNTDIKGRVVSL